MYTPRVAIAPDRIKLFTRSTAAHASFQSTFFNQWGVVGAARARNVPLNRDSMSLMTHVYARSFAWPHNTCYSSPPPNTYTHSCTHVHKHAYKHTHSCNNYITIVKLRSSHWNMYKLWYRVNIIRKIQNRVIIHS